MNEPYLQESEESDSSDELPTNNTTEVSTKNALIFYPSYSSSRKVSPVVGLDNHIASWCSLLQDFRITIQTCNTSRKAVLSALEDMIPNSSPDSVLVIVLCGHGNNKGFILDDDSKLPLGSVCSALHLFRGTIVCFPMYCDAIPFQPPPSIRPKTPPHRMVLVFPGGNNSAYLNSFMRVLASVASTSDYGNLIKNIRTEWIANSSFNGCDQHVVNVKDGFCCLKGVFLQPAERVHRSVRLLQYLASCANIVLAGLLWGWLRRP